MANPTARTHILPRGVLHSTVSGVELNEEQKTAIKDASGVDIDWILFTQSAQSVARELDPGALSITRLTYCW
jgi:hypothetical protein